MRDAGAGPRRPLGDVTLVGKDDLRSQEQVDHKAIPSRMKLDYVHGKGDATQRSLDGLLSLLSHLRNPEMNIDELLREAANMIQRQFEIDNVAIGLRDPEDGLYKYRALAGFREDAAVGHSRIAYTKEQFSGNGEFRGTDISKLSTVYLAEDNVLTDEERKAFNRPAMLTMRRRTPTECLEGDYIDTKICGRNDELLGWIEISGTRAMQLPDARAVKFVEVVASVVGAVLMCQEGQQTGGLSDPKA